MTWEHIKIAFEIGWPLMLIMLVGGYCQASNRDAETQEVKHGE